MQESTRQEIFEIVKGICTGDFRKMDIENLLIKIRFQLDGKPSLREIADFVAHKDNIDKGTLSKSLRRFSYFFNFQREYVYKDIKLNLVEPFPAYVKDLFLLNLEKYTEEEIKSECKMEKG